MAEEFGKKKNASSGDNKKPPFTSWVEFEKQFKSDFPDFLQKLRLACPSLTLKHLQVCAMIKYGLKDREINIILNITERTVESHRRDIRKKLGLKKGELTGFLAVL